MRWDHKRFRPSNSTNASSRIDDFVDCVTSSIWSRVEEGLFRLMDPT